MKTVMRPRYYCDHCKKCSGSPSAMRRHESGCTLNPQRVCGICKIVADEGGPIAQPRDALLRILDAEGFQAMCKAAEDCPACILSALRTRNVMDEEDGSWYVAGPKDGRSEWNFRTAKDAWWAEWNSNQAEREWPY